MYLNEEQINSILAGTGLAEMVLDSIAEFNNGLDAPLPPDEFSRIVLNEKRQYAERELRRRKYKNKSKIPKMNYLEVKHVIDDYEATVPARIIDRFGKCFILTGRFFNDNKIIIQDEDFFLVHGYLFDGEKEDMPFEHAWVELNGFLYDPVFRDFEAVNAVKKARKRRKVHRYNLETAQRYICGDKCEMHWGPWEELSESYSLRKGNGVYDKQKDEYFYVTESESIPVSGWDEINLYEGCMNG